jgi:class 3 adenylate cyclase/tetratricopeptide (TPR) repeat protein
MKVCPSCRRENPEDARFCSGCGTPFDASTSAREERKVVTVLFCDLVGSTAQAERLDPEDVRALLSRYHQQVKVELERFGGTVEKFIGDAVMALFGAPVAHEDDPERAVRAALAVREAVAGERSIRIGITTGETLVTLGAHPEQGEAMAAGDVVNTAARLQSAAPTDGILVDETTYRATERAIEYGEAAGVEAKGKSDAVPAWMALRARSRFGIDVRQVGRSPLVGREREADVLVDALARVKDDRSSQLVTLVGEPGIGKSRLVWELFQRVDAEPDLVTWRQGRSLPYGEGVAFWALAEMVKAECGILETETPAAAEAKLRDTVASLFPDGADAARIEANIRPLLGLETDAGQAGNRRDESFAAWRRFFEALADRRPVVLVFEDLHWADDNLLDFVDYLVEWASGVPLLVVGTARPELLARRAGWGGGKPNSVTLSLPALSEEQTAQLVHALLDRSVLPAEVQRALLERSGGNPLYAEEFARLVADGRPPDELPESVQGVIAARLDALAAEEKALLQDAAVVGKVFWPGALARMDDGGHLTLEERLHALERREFIRRERESSVAGETEYAFRHLLVRDVAYGQIPRPARATKHERVASWIETLGRADSHAEMVAHHYAAAIGFARAAGQGVEALVGPARQALGDAGDRAFALNAFPAAARFYESALGLWESDDPPPAVLLFQRAKALQLAGDARGTQALGDAREALLAAADGSRAAEAEALLGESAWFRGEASAARDHLDRAYQLVVDEPPSASKASVLANVSRFRGLGGDPAAGLAIGSEALAMAEQLDLPDLQASALNNVALARHSLGDRAGLDEMRRAAEIALAARAPEAARAFNNLGALLWDEGDVIESNECFAEAVRLGAELGNEPVRRYASHFSGTHRYAYGGWDQALAKSNELIAQVEAGEASYLEADSRSERAAIRLARGKGEAVLDDVRRIVELSEGMTDPQNLVPALSDAILFYDELGHRDEAAALVERLLDIARLPEPASRPWLYAGFVYAARSLDRVDDARRLLERTPAENRWRRLYEAVLDERYLDAAEQLAEIGFETREAWARMKAAEQLLDAGRTEEAVAQLDRALAFARKVRATRDIQRCEALLARTRAAAG